MKKLLFFLFLLAPFYSFSQDTTKNNTVKRDSSLQDTSEKDSKKIVTLVEQMPSFPGGEAALYRFLNKHLRYPEIARENDVEGKVYIRFIIEKDGRVAGIEPVLQKGKKKIGYGLEEEAIRVMKLMPNWSPGLQDGKPVRVYLTLPFAFNLE